MALAKIQFLLKFIECYLRSLTSGPQTSISNDTHHSYYAVRVSGRGFYALFLIPSSASTTFFSMEHLSLRSWCLLFITSFRFLLFTLELTCGNVAAREKLRLPSMVPVVLSKLRRVRSANKSLLIS